MENRQLTFVTPTLLAGDRSVVSTVAHELAHAWAGNLVTQATWNDVWLNEGLTVYLERRIVGALYGGEGAAAEAVLGRQQLDEDLAVLAPADQRLLVDFSGRDPDEVLSSVPYEKGYLFFLRLERGFGRARRDAFLRRLFRECAFRAFTTAEFLAYLHESLPARVEAWIEQPGMSTDAWSPEQWAWFLTHLPRSIDRSRAGALDETWHLSASRSTPVFVAWLRPGIRCGYAPAMTRAEEVLRTGARDARLLRREERLPPRDRVGSRPPHPLRPAAMRIGARRRSGRAGKRETYRQA